MSAPEESRFTLELDLLQAMYPNQVDFDSRSRDLKYSEPNALLHLRIPGSYPQSGLPELLAATGAAKSDIRTRVKAEIQLLGLTEGEEVLDTIIACFQDIIGDTDSNIPSADSNDATKLGLVASEPELSKTIVIWLHHLLALSKRKLALSPTSGTVSGITKPGYPGVMVFAGPASAVDHHQNILKSENWQAFQVRYEAMELWTFAHSGVKEVETMAEVVKGVEGGKDGERRKAEFLKAVGIK